MSYRNVLVDADWGIRKISRRWGLESGFFAVGLEGLEEGVHGGAVGGDGVDETVWRVVDDGDDVMLGDGPFDALFPGKLDGFVDEPAGRLAE